MPHSNGAHPFIGSVQILAEHAHDLRADLGILSQELQEFRSSNEHDL